MSFGLVAVEMPKSWVDTATVETWISLVGYERCDFESTAW